MIKIRIVLDIFYYPHWNQTRATRQKIYHKYKEKLIEENEHKDCKDKFLFWKSELSETCNRFRDFIIDCLPSDLDGEEDQKCATQENGE